MQALETFAGGFPDAAKDIRMNLAAVLAESALDERTRFAVALASALASGSPDLAAAVEFDGAGVLDDDAKDDARAAVALMAMNYVFYRFRHMIGKPSYSEVPARLRMSRIAKPRMGKAEFELICLAVSAIEGCEACVRAHERSVLESGKTELDVLDAVRIASVVHAAAQVRAMDVRPQVPATR
jgi:alkyl hydroperoxide reductase subunit D